jgi:D-serine deaminase-like pyridoxal phosphate-dependent protein
MRYAGSRTVTHPDVGKAVDDLDTPALLIDLVALDHNITTIAATCAEAGVDWRPHIKASKSPDLARLLIAGGAVGITCSKVSEAEVMAEAGLNDILIANEIVGSTKIQRLVRLADGRRICVAVDAEENLRQIATQADRAGVTVDVLVDIDVGMHRCGVTPNEAVPLAMIASELAGIQLRGLMGYEGHVMSLDPEAKASASAAVADALTVARDQLTAAGLAVQTLSGGGTGNYWHGLQLGVLTETQAGGGVLMDLTYEGMGVKGHHRALQVLCQVISAAASGRAVCDAGWKTTGRHTGMPAPADRDDLEVVNLNAEHAYLRLEPGATVSLGERIRLVPSYSDSTVLLHRQAYAVRDNVVETVWPIAAAGMLQ